MSPWRMLPPAGAPLPPAAILRGLRVGRNGSRALDRFKEQVRQRFNAKHVFLADTGRAALALLFTALRQQAPQRDEVLIPAYVSYSVPSAVVNAGLRAGLYDVDPSTLRPDYESMRRAVSERVLAVVVCHQFGLPFDPSPAAALAREYGAALIDDAAQAMGARCGGRYAGGFGDAGLFSLSRGKPMTAVDGGILITNSESVVSGLLDLEQTLQPSQGEARLLAKALALLALRNPALYRLPASLPGLNLGASIFEPHFTRRSFSAFRSGMASYGLANLEAVNAARVRSAGYYAAKLAKQPHIRLLPEEPGSEPLYLRFPVMPNAAKAPAWEALLHGKSGRRARELGISRGFPQALNAVPELRAHLASPDTEYPGARLLARQLITLPTHEHARLPDRRAVCALLGAARGVDA